MNNYNNEVINKWGQTNIYKEYSNKTKNYSSSKWDEVSNGLNNIIIEFAECLKNNLSFNCTYVQNLVIKLQNYITNNYYTCTNEQLKNLGKMYILDERFTKNIDKLVFCTINFINHVFKFYKKNKMGSNEPIFYL